MNNKRVINPHKHVIIIGAGFGGIQAAQALAKAPVQVTLLDRQNYHLFQPLLYQVATAGLSADEIAYPIRAIFQKQDNLEFQLGEVQSIDPQTRTVQLPHTILHYDYLIMAAGGVTNHFGNGQIARHSFGLKTLDDAVRLRNHVLRQFEKACQESNPVKKKAALTFAIVGGGPSGVESSGALSELVQLLLRKEFRCMDKSDVEIILLEATDRLLANLPQQLGEFTVKTLQEKGIQVRFGKMVETYNGLTLTLADGSSIAAETLIWQTGIQAAQVLQQFPAEKDRIGRLKVQNTLQIPNHPEVFAIGDGAFLLDKNGQPLPMVAPVAMQQGKLAAANIQRLLNHEPLFNFTYKNPGMMATIGRRKAVALLNGVAFKGLLAWLIWLFVHLMQLVGFRNRIMVLINWAWDYLFYEKTVRLIGPE
ncbi:MAG: NAD(P)/FAD-dependent oxidoreductase [Anaerolineaceae bacterium]|nr:NAD(P)/FAD-dependent oxidoreductase [Anaerolineaceae bacterium]